MKTIIHVNQHNIKHNAKSPDDPKPVLTCKTYKDNQIGNTAIIRHRETGEEIARFVYQPDNPLSCGAKVWCSTEHEVVVAA